MAITSAVCTSFKVELLEGKHDFNASAGHTFKIALIKASPTGTYGAATTSYTNVTGNSDEVAGAGYASGGATLTNVNPTSSGTTGFIDFADVTWSTATISASGAIIYNSTTDGGTGTGNAVAVIDFGGVKTSTSGDFTIQFPAADASNAIVRIA